MKCRVIVVHENSPLKFHKEIVYALMFINFLCLQLI